jgi:hypothetical protein
MQTGQSILKKLPGYGLAALALVAVLATGLVLSGGNAFSQTQTFMVTWNLANPPTEGRVGLRLGISNLELTNSGSQTWPKAGADQIKLGYRWFGSDNKPINPTNPDNGYDELRSDLPQDIPPAGRLLFPQFLVGVPNAAGDYTLHIDLVQGTDGWLADKGSPDLAFKVTVRAKDITPPTSQVSALPLFSTSTTFTVTWEARDDNGGSGVAYYDLQYKVPGDQEWHDWLLNTGATSAQFAGENGKLYLFRSRASDTAGNNGVYPENEQASTRVDSLAPSAKIESLPAQSPEVFLVRWSSFDNIAGAAVSLCDVQYREGANGTWTDWLLGTSAGSAIFKGEAAKSNTFPDRASQNAANQGDNHAEAQATTTVSAALDSLTAQLPGGAGSTSLASPVVTATPTPAATPTVSTTVSGTTSATTATPSVTASPTATSTPGAAPSQAAYFPLAVKAGDNGTGSSAIMVYNPGTAPIDVSVSFYGRASAPVSTTVNGQSQPPTAQAATAQARLSTSQEKIGAGETVNLSADMLAPASFNGWVEVRSADTFQAYAVRQPAIGRAIQYGPSGANTRLYLPYLKKADALGSTFLNIANTSADPAEFTITYYDAASGNLLASDKRSLPGYGSNRFSVNALTTNEAYPRFQASAIISSNVALAASVEGTLADGSPFSYPALLAAQPVAPQIPVYREVDGVTTSLLVQNTGKDNLSIKVEYFNSQGEITAAKEINMAGYSRLALWQGDVKELSAGFSGKVRVSTTSPGGALAVMVLGAGPGMNGPQFQ